MLPNVKSCFGKKYDTGIIENSDDLAIYLLQEAKVAVVNGIAFGAPDCLRISYSLSEERIVESIKRIRIALDKLI